LADRATNAVEKAKRRVSLDNDEMKVQIGVG
jgi:hypothetical protein